MMLKALSSRFLCNRYNPQDPMSGPILDIAMSCVRDSSPHFDDEEGRRQIREAFQALIYSNGPREPVAELLEHYIGTTQPLERIEAILQAPETPPPMPRPEVTDPSKSLRKKTRPWAPNEDTRLLAGIHRFGLENWVSVAKFVGNGRSRAQCAQRWVRGLDPRISKDQWSPEDEEKLVHLVKHNGSKGWTTIAAGMGNRSDVQCRYHFLQMRRDGKLTGDFANILPPEKTHSPPIPLPYKGMQRLPRNMSIPAQQLRPRAFSMQETGQMPMQYVQGQPMQYGFPMMPMQPQMGYVCASPPPPMMPGTMFPVGQKLSKERKSASQGNLPFPRRDQLSNLRNASDDLYQSNDSFFMDSPVGQPEEQAAAEPPLVAQSEAAPEEQEKSDIIDWVTDDMGAFSFYDVDL